jgi:hypothetical protein
MNARLQTHTRQTPSSGALSALLQRKCSCGGAAGLKGTCSKCNHEEFTSKPLRTKLQVNEPGDEYEQEADRVAAQVMREMDPGSVAGPSLSNGMLQRRGAGDELGKMNRPMIQRQEASGDVPASEGAKTDDTGSTQDEGSPCPSWRGDPESISKRAAETYVRNDMTPPSQATVEKIDCEPPRDNGNYGCYVHFSDGLVIRVIVREKDIVVGTGPGPFTTLTPPPGTPLCFYEYACPSGDLVLTKRECKSAKPAPSGPTQVAQRRAASGGTGSMDAGPIVAGVLAAPGQPLDAATRVFFSTRFGHDFANVRVHADAEAAESARSVNALAFTVGRDVVFGAGQYAPGTRAGRELLAHELTHVVQQGGVPPRVPETQPSSTGTARKSSNDLPIHGAQIDSIQRQPKSDGPTVRDLPIFLEKLEFDVGKNLQDYGHHLYQAAILHPDEPDILRNAVSRYALGLNVLKDSYRFAGFRPDTADKLALGTGILFKGLTFLQKGEFAFDFQVDIGRGVKFETNLNLRVNPKDVTDVRKADVTFGLVRRF